MNTSPSAESLRTLAAQARIKLGEGLNQLRGAYRTDSQPERLLRGYSRLVDTTLKALWKQCALPTKIALVAVGGYGRGELYPFSDIDLLILLPDTPNEETHHRLEILVGMLWDIGLNIGHSVRTLEECLADAKQDISLQTSLLEARRLTGPIFLFQRFQQRLDAQLSLSHFLDAKLAEQEQRYNRYHDTPYSLEPNCKESPGGLRDLQIIMWIARAAKLGKHWTALTKLEIITTEELKALRRSERFMQHVRIRLHDLANRREDRLLFDLQENLAKAFGIEASKSRRASELMMQRYYIVAKKITQLNTILLQNLAAYIQPLKASAPQAINTRFNEQNGWLDIADEDIFEREPATILESFLLLQQNPSLRGMSARTLRALWHARHRINNAFRKSPANRRLFLSLLQQSSGVVHEFRRMNQYGILGRYLPAFGRIVGQMQHDLFHVYTVDQHILQVLRNVRRLSMEEHAHEYPQMTELATNFERYWLLYIAALFHDIAKGRGGDHSKLGMRDARRFCHEHDLCAEDAQLVTWLVEHHLTLSNTAQKQDITDPAVIEKFARLVRTERRLTALYLLTHADIRGTSPKVWNGWKAKLLEDLFLATRRRLRGDTSEQALGLNERQQNARELLRYFGLLDGVEQPLWSQLDTVYFMRHSSDEIAWHTRMLYYRSHGNEPIVKARLHQIEKGLQVMIYTHDQRDLFMRLCGYFSRLGYSILDAKIHTTRHGYALDSFVLLDPDQNNRYRDMVALIEHELAERLNHPELVEQPASGRLSRQVKHFPIQPEVSVQSDEQNQYAILSIIAADRPGLLYTVAQTLAVHAFNLHTAKISTLGERAEDTFLISGPHLRESRKIIQLEAELMEKLKIEPSTRKA